REGQPPRTPPPPPPARRSIWPTLPPAKALPGGPPPEADRHDHAHPPAPGLRHPLSPCSWPPPRGQPRACKARCQARPTPLPLPPRGRRDRCKGGRHPNARSCPGWAAAPARPRRRHRRRRHTTGSGPMARRLALLAQARRRAALAPGPRPGHGHPLLAALAAPGRPPMPPRPPPHPGSLPPPQAGPRPCRARARTPGTLLHAAHIDAPGHAPARTNTHGRPWTFTSLCTHAHIHGRAQCVTRQGAQARGTRARGKCPALSAAPPGQPPTREPARLDDPFAATPSPQGSLLRPPQPHATRARAARMGTIHKPGRPTLLPAGEGPAPGAWH
ncbi:hypothetical protein H696_02546, partial [Fonticula alba]